MKLHPGLPNAVVRQSRELYTKQGEVVSGVDITIPPELLDEYREGYRCLACHAVQRAGDGMPVAFPEACVEPYCRYPMKDEQPKRFEHQFQGHEELWPEDRFEDIDMERRSQSGIWLP